MTIKLPSELDFLLGDILGRKKIDIASIRNEQGHWTLDSKARKKLMDAVSDEFASTGLDVNDEPNRRGLVLENLLDRLNSIGDSQR